MAVRAVLIRRIWLSMATLLVPSIGQVMKVVSLPWVSEGLVSSISIIGRHADFADCPNFGGFASSATIIQADYWKMGQLKAGDGLQYQRVSLEEALSLRQQLAEYLDALEHAVKSNDFSAVKPIDTDFKPSGNFGKAVLWERAPQGGQPQVRYRQAGDDYVLVEYGNEQFDINYRCRATALEKALHASDAPTWLKDSLVTTVSCCTSVNICYDGSKLDRAQLLQYLQTLEDRFGDLSTVKVPCRKFRLPLAWETTEQREATKRYMVRSAEEYGDFRLLTCSFRKRNDLMLHTYLATSILSPRTMPSLLNS